MADMDMNGAADRRDGKRKFAMEMRRRTLDYGVRAVRFFIYLQERNDSVGVIVGRQFLKAATSIGANVAEAYAAESRADFLHKYSIARKEIYECICWLSLLDRTGVVPPTRLAPLLAETRGLASLITSIVTRTRANATHHRPSCSPTLNSKL